MQVRYIDLFCGMGGFHLGFEAAARQLGLDPVCVLASDIKSAAVKTYGENFGRMPEGDIFAIRSEDIPAFDFLLGGFPCQPFSSAGKRLGFGDTRGTLFFEIQRILAHHKPRGFILENVEGLVKHDLLDKKDKIGQTLSTILHVLGELGYKVTWRVLDSSEFGVAQRRKRIYIAGTRLDAPALFDFTPFKVQLKTVMEQGLPCMGTKLANALVAAFSPEELQGKCIKDKRGGTQNIASWHINLKGRVSAKERKLLDLLLRERRKKKWAIEKGIKWMDGMPLTLAEIETFYSDPNLADMLEKLAKQGYVKLEHPKDLVSENGSLVRRYRTDVPAGYNIVAGKLSYDIAEILDENGSAPTVVATDATRLAVYDRQSEGLRQLSLIEMRRLFGYPDDFKLPVSAAEAYDLFGNTVVVPVVQHAALRTLEASGLGN